MINDFAWLIEAPGPMYLGTREIGHHPDFYWTAVPGLALRFWNKDQADKTMMAIRALEPKLFMFAMNLRDPQCVEHTWLNNSADPEAGGEHA